MKKEILSQLLDKRKHFVQVFEKYKSNNCKDDPQLCFEMRNTIVGIIRGLDEAIYIVEQAEGDKE